MNENINQLNENFETYQEILKDDMDYQNNNITSSNEQIKCYCGHTDYCDCGPLEELKQETLEEVAEKKFPFTNDDSENRLITIKRLFWIDGAKYQAERMYSEEEVIKIVEKSRETGLTAEFLLLTEEFKKK